VAQLVHTCTERCTAFGIVAAWEMRLKRIHDGHTWEITMAWETPSYSDVRFGFEVTMYINNR
jgi:coenzyme PQQ precursor peptide PqqA